MLIPSCEAMQNWCVPGNCILLPGKFSLEEDDTMYQLINNDCSYHPCMAFLIIMRHAEHDVNIEAGWPNFCFSLFSA